MDMPKFSPMTTATSGSGSSVPRLSEFSVEHLRACLRHVADKLQQENAAAMVAYLRDSKIPEEDMDSKESLIFWYTVRDLMFGDKIDEAARARAIDKIAHGDERRKHVLTSGTRSMLELYQACTKDELVALGF